MKGLAILFFAIGVLENLSPNQSAKKRSLIYLGVGYSYFYFSSLAMMFCDDRTG
jgi:hypothetical protein